MAMGEQTRLDLALLLALLMFPVAHAAQHLSSAMPSFPPALRDRLSPLTSQQELYYGKFIKRGGAEAMSESILYEFCKSARLLCSASLRESTWGSAIAAETASLAFESRIDSGKRSLPSAVPQSWQWVKGKKSLPASTSQSAVPQSWQWVKGKKSLPASTFQSTAFREWLKGTQPKGLQQHSTGTYFRENDVMVGAQLVLPRFLYQPTDSQDAELKPSFLPASIADLYLPSFDTHHLKDLLQLFHIPFDTNMAQKMEETLKACEGQSHGKDHDNDFITSLCATSFEAMLKFASSMLRAPPSKIQALTNSKVVGSVGGKVTILRTAELAAGHDAVDCHELMFPFKVMGCHRIKESKAMVARVVDEEGVDMDLLIACHKNTTLFHPQHEAFSELRSSPGHTEICHFLPNSDIMWITL